jgi:hypothetical protein
VLSRDGAAAECSIYLDGVFSNANVQASCDKLERRVRPLAAVGPGMVAALWHKYFSYF